jgi:thiol-disulfide isomerase/thioredoxin
MVSKRFAPIALAAWAASSLFFGPAFADGEKAPPLEITLNGGKRSLADVLAGKKAVLLHFWATWCPSCIPELPKLAALHREIAESGGAVVAVALQDMEPKDLKAFMERHGALPPLEPYQASLPDAMKAYSLRGLPTSFLVDGKGDVVQKFEGERDWDEDMREEILRAAEE